MVHASGEGRGLRTPMLSSAGPVVRVAVRIAPPFSLTLAGMIW